MRSFLAEFVPMAAVGLLVVNVLYAVGVLPLIAFVVAVVAAIVVYRVRSRRPSVKAGD